MILGVGVDLCRIERIRRSLKRFGENWVEELFTPEERRFCQSGADPGLVFAWAFCGKEACFKALGTGRAADIGWHDIEIIWLGLTASVRLFGGALQQLQQITPPGYDSVMQISCADRGGLVQIMVLISAMPKPNIALR